jgi:hypothetical protein
MKHDWWSWTCSVCGWDVKNKFTINPQQAVAKALVHLHMQEHETTSQCYVTAADYERYWNKDKRPKCVECDGETNGELYCVEHKPFMVWPKKDGTFIIDRFNEQQRVSSLNMSRSRE